MLTDSTTLSGNYLNIDNVNVFYRDVGQGEPLLMIHGWPTSSLLWRKIMLPLAERCRVIAPDLVGFGNSDKPLRVSYTFEYHRRMIEGLVDGLGLQRTSLVVHDLGGPIGLLWAVRNPEKVSRIIVLNTFVYPDLSPFIRLLITAARIPGVRELMVCPSGISFAMKQGVCNPKVITKESIAAYKAPFASPGSRKVLLKNLCDPNPRSLREVARKLGTLTVPVRIVYGEKDRALPNVASEMRRLQKDLPNAHMTSIPHCGHFLQEERPERLVEIIGGFMAQPWY